MNLNKILLTLLCTLPLISTSQAVTAEPPEHKSMTKAPSPHVILDIDLGESLSPEKGKSGKKSYWDQALSSRPAQWATECAAYAVPMIVGYLLTNWLFSGPYPSQQDVFLPHVHNGTQEYGNNSHVNSTIFPDQALNTTLPTIFNNTISPDQALNTTLPIIFNDTTFHNQTLNTTTLNDSIPQTNTTIPQDINPFLQEIDPQQSEKSEPSSETNHKNICIDPSEKYQNNMYYKGSTSEYLDYAKCLYNNWW